MADGWSGAQIQLQPLKPIYDPEKQQRALMQSASLLARASRGGGAGGAVGMVPHAIPDPSSPTGYRLEYAPKGTTAKEREAIAAAQQQYAATTALQSDPIISQKLLRMQEAPVSERSAILDDIRQNDVQRLVKSSGLPSGELFNAMLGGIQADIKQQQKEIDVAPRLWPALKMGVASLADSIAAWGDTPAERVARAERHQEYVQKATQENPYLRERAAQQAAGMGAFERIATPTGTLAGEIAASAGEMAPAAIAMMGGEIAGRGLGAAVSRALMAVPHPAAKIAGGLLGAGLALGAVQPQAAIERIAADPNLTDSEKVEAASKAVLPSAGVGFLSGAVGSGLSMALPVAVGAVGQRLFGGAAAQAAPGIIQRAAQSQTYPMRYLRGTGLTATELGGMTAVDVPGQNIVHALATGQPVDTSAGFADALSQAMFAAPFFGLARAGVPFRRQPGQPAKPGEPTTPAPTEPAAPAPLAPVGEISTRFQVGQARRALKETLAAGQGIDADVYIRSLREQGWTEQQFKDLFEQPGVARQAKLDPDTVQLLRAAHARIEMPATDAAFDIFRNSVRGNKIDENLYRGLIDQLEQSGLPLEDIRERVNATAQMKGRDRIANEKRNTLDALIEERIATRTGATPDVTPAATEPAPPAAAVAIAEGGRAPETAVVGPDGLVREAEAPRPDIPGDRGVEADTAAALAAAAGERAAEPVTRDRAVEGGRAGRPEEPNLRPVETVDGVTQAAGTEPGIGADPRPSVVPAAAADATPRPGAGEPTSPAVGNASRAGGTETTRATAVAPVTREQITVRLGRSDAKVTSPTGELFTVFRDADGWNVVPGEAGTKIVSGERTRNTAVERAKDIALERSNRIVEPEAPLSPEVKARANEQVGLTSDMAEFQSKFTIPGETPMPRIDVISRRKTRSPEITWLTVQSEVADRLITPKKGVKSFGRTDTAAKDHAMDLLLREALGEKITPLEMTQLEYLHTDLGYERLDASSITGPYQNAKALGMDVSPLEVVKALSESTDTYKKLIDRWACGA